MTPTTLRRWLALGLLPAALCACGGGDAGGGGSGSFASVGTLSGFGSVIVNGVKFDTAGTAVQVDDRQDAAVEDLQVGMVVQVEGTAGDNAATGKATRITARRLIQGPITKNPLTLDAAGVPTADSTLLAGQLEVLHQNVKLDDGTVFSDDAIPENPHQELEASNLAGNEIVVVRGVRDDKGVIHATRVERKAHDRNDLPKAEQGLQLKGAVSTLGTSAFVIGGQAVSFTSAVLDPVIVAKGGLVNGMVVEVKSLQALDAAGNLIASSVQFEDDGLPEAEGLEVKVRGLVTQFNPATPGAFEVNGQAISTSPATIFRPATATLDVGRGVEAEGTMQNGVLQAKKVSFELARNVKIVAPVEAVSVASGTATLLGVSVKVDASTLMKDEASGLRAFGLAGLGPGEWADVRAFLDDQGHPVAARLSRKKARTDGRVRFQGPLDPGSTSERLRILGVAVPTAGIPRFEDEAGNRFGTSQAPDPASFFTAANQGGKLVKMRGTLSGNTVTWERAELEVKNQFENEQENEFEFELENEVEIRK